MTDHAIHYLCHHPFLVSWYYSYGNFSFINRYEAAIRLIAFIVQFDSQEIQICTNTLPDKGCIFPNTT